MKATEGVRAADEHARRSTDSPHWTGLPVAARVILEAAPDAMIIADHRGHIVLMNAVAERLFGYSHGELVGQSIEILIPERFREDYPHHRATYFADPATRPMGDGLELYGLRKNRVEFPAEISVSPLVMETGVLAMMAVRETTERNRAEQERLRLAQAQEAVRIREEFMSIAAHELRTPLTALQLQLDGLQQSLRGVPSSGIAPDYARVRAKVEKAVKNTTRLTDLVNTLLDMSRIMSGRMRLRLAEVDLAAVIREAVDEFGEQPEGNSHRIVVDTPGVVPALCDRFRIEQVLVNLLSNAAKYGLGGAIEVLLQTKDDWVELTVSDHGIGIPAGDLERIFDKFERLPSARNYGGLGIGLYISRHLVEAHGGNIHVTSKEGVGSSFVVRLPVRPEIRESSAWD